MSLKKNTIANYLGQAYTILIGIVILPFYLKYLGVAAYGLVGVFMVMQAWLRLLDMGLTPTLARQVAYTRGKQYEFKELIELLRSLECVFFVLAIIITLVIILNSGFLARHWLKLEGELSYDIVSYCISLMGIMVGLRWFSDLYMGGIRGMEYQVWLNKVNVIIATLQSMGAWMLLRWVTREPVHFFEYQLLISLLNLLIMRCKFYHLIQLPQKIIFNFSWKVIKLSLPFAGATAYTAGIWIIITQLDKLLLAHILPLSQYAYFSIIVIVSGGIVQVSSPISLAILPRMTYLLSNSRQEDMLKLYHNATQAMAVIIFAVSGVVATFSSELLYAWTQNQDLANWGGPILFWYAIGNGVLSVLAFQYYLQYAYGKLRLHVIFNTISAVIVIPLIFYAAYHYGALGTAITWFTIQLATFLVYPGIVHKRYAPGIHFEWIFKDIFPILVSTLVLVWGLHKIPICFYKLNRWEMFGVLLSYGMIVLIGNAMASKTCRVVILEKIKGR